MIPGSAPVEDYSFHELQSGGWNDVTGMTTVSPVLNSSERTLVILILGQSQPANHGQGVYTVLNPTKVHNFNPFNGLLYQMKGKVLGPTFTIDGYAGVTAYGSYSGLLGDVLIARNVCDRVIIANVAYGGVPAIMFTPGGYYHHWITNTLKKLRGVGLRPDFVLYHQGESDSFHLGATPPTTYQEQVQSTFQVIKNFTTPQPKFIVAQATWLNPSVYTPPQDDGIRAAQVAINMGNGVTSWPDFDTLGAGYRDDGLHFGLPSGGQALVAQMWVDAIVANM